jgi:hypothetical protein
MRTTLGSPLAVLAGALTAMPLRATATTALIRDAIFFTCCTLSAFGDRSGTRQVGRVCTFV